MKRILPISMLIGGAVLFAIAFMFYQKSESIKSDTDALRSISTGSTEIEAPYAPPPEPEYDAADLDQTPPGVTPFIPSSVCYADWGNHLRQYCTGGNNGPLELIEGGSNQAESMHNLKICLNASLQQIDTYKTDLRPMDSKVEQNETNRKSLACELTKRYGDSPVFNDGSIYYIIKEHMESGNINRLESR